MKKIIVLLTVTAFFVSLGFSAMAEIKVSSDIETYYESASDVDGPNDDDRFQINQLYLTIDGKYDGYDARLKLNGAPMLQDDNKAITGTETSKYVEEANFTMKDIGGSPVSVVFGKDEMPFGMDYDKYLTDPLVHYYEIDKVWGIHTIIDIEDVGSVAFAIFEAERYTNATTDELGDHYAARVKIDKLVENLSCEVSFASVQINDNDTTAVDEDEQKYSVGAIYHFMEDANVNLEYTGFSSKGGVADYDPALISLGVEKKIDDCKVYARVEHVLEDAENSEAGKLLASGGFDPDFDVEENFYMVGASYTPVKNYTLSLELANFSSGNVSAAKGLSMAEDPDTLESSIKFGIRAKF